MDGEAERRDGSKPRRPNTMAEFAAAAGVSRPTASKFFNDPDSVRPASRERIRRAAAEFDYHPNLFAVNFNRRSPKTIGIVVPSLTDPFYAEVVRQVELGAIAAGYWSIVLSSHADPGLEARALQALTGMKVAGVLIAPLGDRPDARRLDARRLDAQVPTVFLDSRLEAAEYFVGTDNAQSFDLIVDYLCRTGPPPCLVAMPDVNRNAHERRAAYLAAMRRLGCPPAVVEPSRRDWAFEEIGFEVACRALEAGGFPSRSVLCANDRLAFGVMAAATQKGLRIGRASGCDLRVAGHDDHPLSRFSSPTLTTVAQDFEGIATTALSVLMTRIDPPRGGVAGKRDRVTLFDAKLMLRDSA